MLLGRLLDLLQMLVIAIFSEPRDDIALRPINLETMIVFVVYVILEQD
jgi:hypothetical protein